MLAAQIETLMTRRTHLQDDLDLILKLGADNTEVVTFSELQGLTNGEAAPLNLSANARRVIHQIAVNDLGQRIDEIDRQLDYMNQRERVSS